jgi:predicted phage-related endonuclease
MSTIEITGKVRQIKELQFLIDEATAEMETYKDEIKAEMTARNTEEIIADVFKVRWTTYASSRIDTTALKKELPDVAARYTKTTEARRFQVA